MVIKTYVNEIDISKVDVGQHVQIGVDAFPQNKYSGVVIQVANIGEQMNNSNSKVFEVMIQVNEYDSILRPAMTTKNSIITDEISDVLFVPLEAIHGTDSLQYVFSNGVRKQVIAGQSNDNEIVILEGLYEGDLVWLTQPENHDDYRLVSLPAETLQKYESQRKSKSGESQKGKEIDSVKSGKRPKGFHGTPPDMPHHESHHN
jgi:Membrane-fusion protein